jgi:23S rRNA (guanine745-N1)-methyltransferase
MKFANRIPLNKESPMTHFICPLCRTSFQQRNKTQICANNHHFDIAKEGYLNLLPVNAKNSKNPGDNKEMMTARRHFLDSGGYAPLAAKLSQLLVEKLAEKKHAHILDLGCGEGYYTQIIKKSLPNTATVSALDISKIAIRYAAKRDKHIHFCVASAYDIPLKDNSLDALVRIYAPSLERELLRVIKSGGILVTVTPAPRHLFELRQKIYESVTEHQVENNAPDGFEKIEYVNLNYQLKVTESEKLKSLVNMTPFAWKFNEQMMNDLLAQKKWEIECDFNIEVYRKLETK